MAVIQLENATKIYTIGEVETRALDGVDLSIEEGEFTAVVGPSGAGQARPMWLGRRTRRSTVPLRSWPERDADPLPEACGRARAPCSCRSS